MTDAEKKARAAAKRSETYRKKREKYEADRQEQHARYNDRVQGLAICRAIRDNPDSTDEQRLEAISIIERLTAAERY